MEPSQSETQYAGGEVSRTIVHCLWKVSGNCVYCNMHPTLDSSIHINTIIADSTRLSHSYTADKYR